MGEMENIFHDSLTNTQISQMSRIKVNMKSKKNAY